MTTNGPQVTVTTQTRLQAVVMALAAALVLVVPVVTGSVVTIMVERNHEQLLHLRCTGTPGTPGRTTGARALLPGVPGSLLLPP